MAKQKEKSSELEKGQPAAKDKMSSEEIKQVLECWEQGAS